MSESKEKSEAPADAVRVDLPISGMNCAGCAINIEKILKETDGVESASVNFATSRATVLFAPRLVTPEALIRAVESAGYSVIRPGAGDEGRRRAGGPGEGLRPPEAGFLGRPGLQRRHPPWEHAPVPALGPRLSVRSPPPRPPGDARPVLDRPPLLQRRLGLPQAQAGGHEHARGRGDVGRLFRKRRGDALPRVLHDRRRPARRLFRYVRGHHHPHPLRTDARSPGQGPDLRSDQEAHRPPAPDGPRHPRRRRGRPPGGVRRRRATSSSSGPGKRSRSTAS